MTAPSASPSATSQTASPHDYVAGHYAPRAQDYLTSATHSGGPDLEQIEAALQGCGATRVLDLGCGGGHVSYRAAPHVAEVVALDVTATMLEAVARTAAERGLHNISVQQGAAERLPFAAGHFDIVLCRFSAHHWPDWEAGLREARRVLRPDGWAMFIDSVAPADAALDSFVQTIELLRDPSHVRNQSLGAWAAALERAGFLLAGVTPRRLRLDFASWVARTRTPDLYVDAIRALQTAASAAAQAHFAFGADGSFDLDTATLVARAG